MEQLLSRIPANNCKKQPPDLFRKIEILKNFTKLTEKHLCRVSFLLNLQV